MATRRRRLGCSRPSARAEIVPGRASYAVRLWTPVAKGVQRLRGNGRIRPGARRERAAEPATPVGRTIDRWLVGPTRRTVGVDGGHPHPRPARAVPRHATAPSPPPVECRVEREPDAEQMSLARRLRQPRTIISIAVPIVDHRDLRRASTARPSAKVPGLVLGANPLLVLLAFLVFYAGFPLRGKRWALLLRGTGLRIGTKDSTEIIFLSWLVNCVVPAKLGDVYRAYLLKINSTASLSRTFGTVFIERVLDLFAIAILGLAAGYWSFRSGLPPAIQVVFGIGVVVVVVLAIALFTMRNFGRQIIVALPAARTQILDLYDRFEEGVFGALAARQLPVLGVLTGLIWMTEALRLFLVVQALGFADVSLGLSGAVFVALIGSLLTAVPLSPAGLGIVEAGVVGVLHVAYGVPLARGDGDRPARSRHQRLLDHRLRVDRLRHLARSRAGWASRWSPERPMAARRRHRHPSDARCRSRCMAAAVRNALARPASMAVPHPRRATGRTFVQGVHLPVTPATARRRPHSSRPLRSGVAGTDRYQRGIQAGASASASFVASRHRTSGISAARGQAARSAQAA